MRAVAPDLFQREEDPDKTGEYQVGELQRILSSLPPEEGDEAPTLPPPPPTGFSLLESVTQGFEVQPDPFPSKDSPSTPPEVFVDEPPSSRRFKPNFGPDVIIIDDDGEPD